MSPRRNVASTHEYNHVPAIRSRACPHRRRYMTLAAPLLIAGLFGVSGCSDDDADVEAIGSGGTTSVGGSTAKGGSTGVGGGTAKGGTSSVGGSAVAGTDGGSVGGSGGTGGTGVGGGTIATGGQPVAGAGGVVGSGGAAGGGGTVTGGAPPIVAGNAGTPATGGVVITAGAGGVAGAESTGGTPGSGGVAGPSAGAPSDTGGTTGTGGAGDAAGAPSDTGGTTGTAGSTNSEGGTGGVAGAENIAGAAGSGVVEGPPVPILQYNFDETTGATADDATTNNNDGTATSVTWSASPNSRNVGAASFAAADSVVAMPAGKFVNTHAITVSAWVHLSVAAAADTKLFYIGDSAGTAFLTLNLNLEGTIALQYRPSGGTLAQMGTQTQLPAGVWKHVTVTGSSAGTAIYVDGKIVANSATVKVDPAALGTTTTDIVGNGFNGANAFQGLIDEFYVDDGVIPLADIRQRAWPKLDYSMFHFEEGTGTTTEDSSDRNFDGTLTEGAAWVSGPFGKGVKLDNPADSAAVNYVTLSGAVAAGCSTTFTFAGWVSVETHNENARIFEFASNDNYRANLQTWSTGASNPILAFEMRNTSSGTTSSRVIRIQNLNWPTITWYHVAVVRDNTGGAGRFVTVYRNGSVATSAALSTGTAFNGWPTMAANYFGRGFADTATTSSSTATTPTVVNVRGFDGSMDEILVSCRNYTADEIKHLAYLPM